MSIQNYIHYYKGLTLCAAFSLGITMMPSQNAHAQLSGNIGVVSKYVLRGITTPTSESDDPAVQGGLDYVSESGAYLGYWGSSLGYSDDEEDKPASGFENELYAGYAFDVGEFSFDLGAIYYAYMSIDDADVIELSASVGYGSVSASMLYLTDDVVWGNQGDIYWTLAYEQALPSEFTLAATLGWYTYGDEGDYIPSTEEDDAFRHFTLSLSHPLGATGADMNIDYIIGGDDRSGLDQDDMVVLGLSMGFDL